MEIDKLGKLMKDCGVAGAGGAGFPSYAKLAGGADTLLVNGSECEPLLYTDYYLLKTGMPEVLAGIRELLEALGISRAFLCIKEHTAKRLRLSDGETLAEKVAVKTLPDVYPMGDEISLIYQATGRIVKPGCLPITAGVIVYNVETVCNIAAACNGTPVTMKWLTVGGDIPEAIVVRVPVGTPVTDLFEKYGITVPEDHTVLDGGPSMGKIIDERAVVTKTTKGILILPDETEAIQSKLLDAKRSVARAETACCQCTHCTDMCPRALLGYPIEPHKLVRTARQAVEITPEMAITASLCCGCGVCTSVACCQEISPKAVIDYYKGILAKNKLKYISKEEPKAEPEREYRMIPSERWAKSLGVGRFDRVPVFRGEDREFSRVEVRLSQHIGAPSKAIVGAGETVEAGQRIADSAEGLSLPQYAPIAGQVKLVTEKKIVIDRG